MKHTTATRKLKDARATRLRIAPGIRSFYPSPMKWNWPPKMLQVRQMLVSAAVGMLLLAPMCEGGEPSASPATVLNSPVVSSPPSDAAMSPDEALRRLLAGNQRFTQGACIHPDQVVSRRAQLAVGQHPFATILSCSDSRVPPELIFDQGLGNLFVVRVAGNVADDDVLGTLEYAVEHLHCPLIVVLGHSQCGAVTAAVSGKRVSGHLRAIIRALRPAVESRPGRGGGPVAGAGGGSVRRVVSQLQLSGPILEERVKTGALKVVGARYDLVTGAVRLLP